MRRLTRHHVIAISLPVLLLGILALAALRKSADPVLASADVVDIDAGQFKQAYTKWLNSSGVPDAPERRVAFIKDLAATQLVVHNARKAGIEQEQHYQDKRARLRRKLLIDLYVQTALLDSIKVTESDVKEAYRRAQTQITARHLYARTLPEARRLHSRLEAGADWNDLAQSAFQDQQLQQSGGLLPPFTFDETDPGFEEAAFTLPVGTYSQPVRTAQGYSIIKVEKRWTRPIITETEFAAKRPLFEVYVRSRKEALTRRAFLLSLVEESNLTFDESVLEALLKRILRGGQSESSRLWNRTLLSYGTPEVAWTVADFREHARFASDRQRSQVRDLADLRDFTSGLVAGAIILERAAPLEEDAGFQERLRIVLDDYIVSHMRQTLEVSIEEHEIAEYYEKAPATEFTRPPQVELTWQTYSTEQETRQSSALDGAYTTWFEAADLGPMADEAFSAKPGDRLGPFNTEQGWVAVTVGAQRGARRRSLEELHGTIEAMLREQRLRTQRVALYDSLVRRHDLIIHEDILAELALDS